MCANFLYQYKKIKQREKPDFICVYAPSLDV